MNGLATQLASLHRAETALADALRRVADAHPGEPDVSSAARTLAALGDTHLRALAPMLARHPADGVDAPGALPPVPATASLVRDLQDLHGLAAWVELAWDVVGRAAAALRDRDLQAVVRDGSRDAGRRVRWVRSRVEQAAAQALVLG